MSTISDSNYCAHALGGLEEMNYTNSKEALENSYSRGARLFEADVHLTSDGVAVLSHGWKKNDYLKRLGEENYPEAYLEAGKEYIPTYAEFMSYRIRGRFTPLDFAGLAQFMREHNDMYVLVDIWSTDYEGTKTAYTAIVEACDHDDNVLSHLISGGHTKEMIDAVKSVYDFEILNLYYSDEILNDSFTTEDFIAYCRAEGIQSLSCADSYFTAEVAQALENSGLIIYVFTVNDPERARLLLSLGADVVGTDFLI